MVGFFNTLHLPFPVYVVANVVGVQLHMNCTAPCVYHSFCASPKDIINCPQKEFSVFFFSFSPFIHIKSLTYTTAQRHVENASAHSSHTHKNSNVNANANTIGNMKLFMFHLMSRLCLISRSLWCACVCCVCLLCALCICVVK